MDPQLVRVVISDIHGNYEALAELLREIGVIDGRGTKSKGFYIVQLGDALHFQDRTVSGDLATARLLERVADEVLCGNHELWFAWRLRAGIFSKMTRRPEPELTRTVNRWVHKGWLMPATSIDNWLVTHAGIHRSYQKALPPNAEAAAREINKRFEKRIRQRQEDPLFDSIGRVRSLGKDQKAGGLFWCDLTELLLSGNRMPQVVGHTPLTIRRPHQLGELLWAIDPGAPRVAAIVKGGIDDDWECFYTGSMKEDGRTLALRMEEMEASSEEAQSDGSS